MLKIVNIYGAVMELARDQVITVDKYNPLFNDAGKLFQDISLPGTAPFTENNKIFFRMGQLVEAANETYSIPANFYKDDIQLAAGNVNYRIAPAGYEFNLEPNLTAVNGLLKNIRLPELRTEDAVYFASGTDTAAYEAFMLDTVQNPDKYPFIFIPVRNAGFGSASLAHSYHWVNKFDPVLQQFLTTQLAGDAMWQNAQSPMWKVAYIIKQVANYLGFAATGSFFTNPETKNLCIYTRMSSFNSIVYPSSIYMPNILVSDFLKFCRERLHIALDFDLISVTLRVETFRAIKNSKNETDLTPYITTTIEQEVPAGQNFKVTLKTDQQDPNFLITDLNGNDTYPPLFTLITGDGSTPVELDCSTLKAGPDPATTLVPGQLYCWTNQSVFNTGAWNGGIPPDLSYTDPSDPTTLNNWPLRIINYLGYQDVEGGKFPNSEPYDLGQDDMDYYRSLNDSKRLILTTAIPPSVLGQMRVTGKYVHRTAGNNYTRYILEQISYDAIIDSDLITAKMYARTLNYQVNTKAAITTLTPVQASEGFSYNAARVKAYFDPLLHGITQLDMTIIDLSIHAYPYTAAPITIPTTPKGTGGVATNIISTAGISGPNLEIRIFRGQPKYILHMGVRQYFSQVANYYTVTITPVGLIVGGFAEYYGLLDDFVIFF